MKSLRFDYSIIQKLKPPCYVIIPTTYCQYGVTYILMGFDKEKQKYRLVSARDPFKERFVKGDLLVVTGVKFEDI
jgi:hypothetical protein